MGSWLSKPSSASVDTKKKIVICGHSASGKTYGANALRLAGEKVAISYTTRPMRDNEANGRDYHFVSEAEFDRLTTSMYECVSHGEHRYGITDATWNECTVFVMNPGGVQNICDHGDRDQALIVYLDIPEATRVARLKTERQWGDPEIAARIMSEQLQFKSFTTFDVRVVDPNHNMVEVVNTVSRGV